MSLVSIFGILSFIFTFVGIIPYIISILKKETKPQRISWFIWSSLGIIALFSQLTVGGGYVILMTIAQTIVTGIIFILSIRYGIGGTSKTDKIVLVMALVAILLLVTTKNALISVLITVFADFLGTFSTVTKTYKEPNTEPYFPFLMSSISGLLSFFSIGSFEVTLIIYPLYIFFANLTIMGSKYFSPNKK